MTTQPTIELKSVNVQVTLSDETPAYTAKLYVDGKFFADVSNHGTGGCDNYRYAPGVTDADFVALNKRVGETFPKLKMEGFDDMDTDIETICHGLAWDSVELRNLQSKLSRKVLVQRDGNVYELTGKKSPQLIEAAVKKYGQDNVLNLLGGPAALAIMKSCSL